MAAACLHRRGHRPWRTQLLDFWKAAGSCDMHRPLWRVVWRRHYLWPVPKESTAVGGSAPTDRFLIAQTIKVVIKSQLCPWGKRRQTPHQKLSPLQHHMGPQPASSPTWLPRSENHPRNLQSPEPPGLVLVPGPHAAPAGMSHTANRPTRVSPFTVHLSVSQLGWQLWFINRE